MLAVSASATANRVEDADTHDPIAAAYVVTTWSAFINQIVQATNTCFHLDIAQTDGVGSYQMPSFAFGAPNMYEIKSRLVVYKEGYRALEPLSRNVQTVVMRRDDQANVDRMKYVIGLAEEMLCGTAEERRGLIAVFKRMYEEMNAATNRSVPQLKLLSHMQYMIDVQELGLIKATKAWDERRAAWGLK